MDPEFVNLTPENLADEHLSCIIRVRKPHPGVEAKRQWLADRLREGHVFRKLQVKDPVFIEYAPLETAWVPVLGDNYLYVYCLWAYGAGKGKGYGRALMEYCLADARVQGKSGVCLLGAKKQKAWLTDQAFARKFGFEVVDATDDGYELLALSFDGTVPRFAPHAKAQAIDDLLRFPVPLRARAHRGDPAVLRGERRAADAHPSGFAAKGEGAARRL